MYKPHISNAMASLLTQMSQEFQTHNLFQHRFNKHFEVLLTPSTTSYILILKTPHKLVISPTTTAIARADEMK